MEQWRDIPDWPYQVSDQGRVRSIRTGKILSPERTNGSLSGYHRVTLSNNGNRQRFMVHVLMLEAFVGPRSPGMQACHLNDDGIDNRLENLRWDTQVNNAIDCIRNGNHPNYRKQECVNGHPYDDKNTYVSKAGVRQCRKCHADREAQYRRHRQARVSSPAQREGLAKARAARKAAPQRERKSHG